MEVSMLCARMMQKSIMAATALPLWAWPLTVVVVVLVIGDVLLRRFRARAPRPDAAADSAEAEPSSPVPPRQDGAHWHRWRDGVVRLPDGRRLGYRDHRPVPHAETASHAHAHAHGPRQGRGQGQAAPGAQRRTSTHGDDDDKEEEAVLFYLHGLMGSRREFFGYRRDFAARHVRMIAVDRPGYGLSTYSPNRRCIADFADDIVALADHLHVRRFAVVGWSSGGCYALACAARIPPDRLLHVGTAAL
jgi:hypothetical protein